jgi:ABC-type nitrate/sulfonate/bicarbonate transport system substrate-binding protein
MFKKKGVNPDQVSYIQTGSVSNSLAALNSGAVNGALLSIPNNVIMTQKGFNQLTSTTEAGVNFPPAGLSVHVNKLQKESGQIKRVMEAMLDSLDVIETDSAKVAGYIQSQWKLTPALALETQRLVRPTLVATGKMNLERSRSFSTPPTKTEPAKANSKAPWTTVRLTTLKPGGKMNQST